MNAKKFLLFAIGPISASFLGVITLPIVTWFFSQDDVGRIAMLYIAMSFSTLVFCLGLDQAYVREYNEVCDKCSLLKITMLPGLTLLSVVGLLLFIFDYSVSGILFGVNDNKVDVIVLVIILIAYISRFFSLVVRMNDDGFLFSMSQFLPKVVVLMLLGISVLLAYDKNFFNLLLINFVSIIFGLIVLCLGVLKVSNFTSQVNFNVVKLSSMLMFGLPLIVSGVAFWGLTALDKVFLRYYTDFEQIAIYSVAVSFAAAASILQGVFTTVWVPTIYKWAKQSEDIDNFISVTRYILLLVISLFCLAGLLSWLVPLILPEKYYDVQWIVVACMSYPLLYTLSETTGVGIGISRKSVYALIAALTAFVLNTLLNFALVPTFTTKGAAISTCLSFFLYFFLKTEFSNHVWKTLPRKLVYSYTTACVIGVLVTTFYGADYFKLTLFYWMSLWISTVFFFRKELLIIRSNLTTHIINGLLKIKGRKVEQ